jgi:hypothetical protein
VNYLAAFILRLASVAAYIGAPYPPRADGPDHHAAGVAFNQAAYRLESEAS